MSDLISRRTAIERAESCTFTDKSEKRKFMDWLKYCLEQPTVEAVPVVHGEWKRVGSGSLYDVYECTNCHRQPKWDCLGDNCWKIAFTDFCPNCGADMRKKV